MGLDPLLAQCSLMEQDEEDQGGFGVGDGLGFQVEGHGPPIPNMFPKFF